eukprot:gene4394-6806_t
MREALAKSQQSEREMQAAISATQKRLRKQEKLLRESENLKATLLSTVDRQKGQLNEARAEISSLMAYNAGLTVQASSVHDDSQSAEQERIRKASLLEAARLQHKDLLIAQQKLSVQEKELSSLRESTAPSLIMTLQADLAKARAELSRSNASISRLQSDIRRLDSEKSQKDSLLSPLEAELTRRQSYAGDLAGELVKAKEVLTGLEAENSKLKEEVLRTQSQQWEASELEGQLQYLQSELRRVRDEFEAEQLVGKSEKLRTEMRAKDDVIANLQRALRDQAMATAKSEIELTRIRNGGGEGCKDEVERVRAALKARLSSWNEIEKEVADRCGVVKDLLSAFESVRMEVNDRQKDNERLWAAVEGLVGGIQMRAAEMRVDGATISLAEVVKQRDDALALADFFQRESEAAASLRAFSRQQTLRRPDATTPVSSAANSGASPESVRSPKELVRALESLESRRQSENARSAATIAALTLRIDEMDGGIEGAAVLENKLADLSKDLAFSKGTLQSRIRALEKVTHAAETDAAATANTVRILKEQLREKDRVIDTLRAHVDAFHQSRPSLVYE